jgi:hypothetical protein
MFDLTTTTILSLIVPTIVAPLACLGFVRAIARAEAARRTTRGAAPIARIVLDPVATAPLTAEHVRERSVA